MAKNETQQYLRTSDVNQKIIANIDNGIIVLNDTLHIKHYNKWLELHTGIKEKDILDKELHIVFQNIKSKTLIRKIKTALQMDSPTFYSASTSKYLIPIKINQIKNINFEYMQQDVSIIPFDKENSLVALIITDQTNMANTNSVLESHIQKIKELNTELLKERNTIDKKILFLKFDKRGIISDISQALLKLLKYKKEDLLGENFFQYTKSTLEDSSQEELLQHIQNKESFNFEQKVFTSKDKEIWLQNSLIPEYDSKGVHLGFILFRENITNTKLVEKNHEKMLINSRSAAMGEMISMIAHQWRQPLSLINTVLATIKIKREIQQLDEESLDNYFEKIETTTNYLSETIDDFRSYFKPNKEISKINISTLFDKSIFFLKEEMFQLNIKYITDIDESIVITTYKNELLQSIINIIKNSVDAFEESQTNKQITVSIKNQKNSIVIYMKDNAGGIPETIINKIYEPYFSTKSKNGTGLGLYMCSTIINEHLKGELNITSENGETLAIIKLPKTIEQKAISDTLNNYFI